MHDNTAAREDSPDSQLDLGNPCISDSKKGLAIRKRGIALIFTRHIYFKGIATKAYVADYGISHAESLRFTFLTLYNYQFYDNTRFLAL